MTVACPEFIIAATTTPLIGLSAVGRYADTTIVGGMHQVWAPGERVTAVIGLAL